jgi:hypothetical protein
MTVEKRMTVLEKTLETHLIESGEIRSDLAWLKKAFWTLAASGLTFLVMLAIAFITYIIHK